LQNKVRVAVLGAGTIARLVLERARAGDLPEVQFVAVSGRSRASLGVRLADEFGIPFVVSRADLLAQKPDAVLEAASHGALREHLVPLLEAGVSVIVLSAGALVEDDLRHQAEQAAKLASVQLYVPSGGIGGLDALKAACAAGVDHVSIQVAKPPAAWKGIPYVQALGVDLVGLDQPFTLFQGRAIDGVPHFPQNVNIAAVLSLAGIGAERTLLKVVADPSLKVNTHTIRVEGNSGRITLVMENVPSLENPKTSWLACYSAIAALRSVSTATRYGT
jgi:aspartate dehydrogenase